MIINFGKKHIGKSVEFLVLKEPSYVKWTLDSDDITGPLLSVKNEMLRLIEIFDRKVIIKKCAGHNCDKGATRTSLYKDNTSLMWWCDDCGPDPILILNGRIHLISSYREALFHVERYCGGRKSDYQALIRDLAQAKGLPLRAGEKQARSFFFKNPSRENLHRAVRIREGRHILEFSLTEGG